MAKKKVFIIDDNNRDCQDLKEMIESNGYKVVLCRDDYGIIEDIFEEKLKKIMAKVHESDKVNLYSLILKRIEKLLIQQVLKKTNGNQIKAADILGINRNTLRKKGKELKISFDKSTIIK